VTPLVITLLLLHAPEGADVAVNSEQITTLRGPPQQRKGTFTTEARCMINTSDGKFIAVIETCETVRKLMEPSQ
jgi:hypothetical protein